MRCRLSLQTAPFFPALNGAVIESSAPNDCCVRNAYGRPNFLNSVCITSDRRSVSFENGGERWDFSSVTKPLSSALLKACAADDSEPGAQFF